VAVFTTHPVIEGLWGINFLTIDPNNDRHIKRIALVFMALFRGIENLKTFYGELGRDPAPSKQQDFPYLRQFQSSTGEPTKFNYTCRLFDDQSRTIWKAENEDKAQIIVKSC
jgi:hypothetical protein